MKSGCKFHVNVYPSPPLDNIRAMVIVWRLRGNIIRTVLCWIVWHSVHSPQHTYMSSSYRSNRLGLSHWDPYTVCRGGCLELYYCLQNDLLCVEWDVKPYTLTHYLRSGGVVLSGPRKWQYSIPSQFQPWSHSIFVKRFVGDWGPSPPSYVLPVTGIWLFLYAVIFPISRDMHSRLFVVVIFVHFFALWS